MRSGRDSEGRGIVTLLVVVVVLTVEVRFFVVIEFFMVTFKGYFFGFGSR